MILTEKIFLIYVNQSFQLLLRVIRLEVFHMGGSFLAFPGRRGEVCTISYLGGMRCSACTIDKKCFPMESPELQP